MMELFYPADTQVLKLRVLALGKYMELQRLDLICLSDPALRRYLIDEAAEGNLNAYLIMDNKGRLSQITGKGKRTSHAAGLDVEVVSFVDYDMAEWVFPRDRAVNELGRFIRSCRPHRIGFDFHFSGVSEDVIRILGGSDLHDIRPFLNQMRVVKAPYEIERIRRAGLINCAAYEAVKEYAKEQVSEIELFAIMSERAIRSFGYPVSFANMCDFISGERSTNAAGPPTERRVQNGDTIIVDLFPTVHGYHADNCRTFTVGEPSFQQLRFYETVISALKKAEALLLPGNRVKDIFHEVNEILKGIGNEYTLWHHLGHGVGVNDQEAPYLIPGSDEMLQEGAVISVEPAIYMQGVGVRIENVYHIRKDGPENLTPFPTEL